MRKEIIAGNWKMFMTPADTKKYFKDFADKFIRADREVRLFVPYLCLEEAKASVGEKAVAIGAQNMHFEQEGAFTGEISAEMLQSIGINNVLIGHSERRKYFGETDETVNLKVKKAVKNGINAVVCVGEDLFERENDLTKSVLSRQLKEDLKEVESIKELVVAYEPLWAIGTGKTATPEVAQETCAFIREVLKDMYGKEADEMRILYGGSVKAANIGEIMNGEDIDGVLVGGASLNEEFVRIVNY